MERLDASDVGIMAYIVAHDDWRCSMRVPALSNASTVSGLPEVVGRWTLDVMEQVNLKDEDVARMMQRELPEQLDPQYEAEEQVDKNLAHGACGDASSDRSRQCVGSAWELS
mmetsp:Transcript_101957/g.327182  ORF Transcript_101957/g.327182 Transcript_101957/m.327182 type:complete len:112 (+) Transcript_101957:140-475(+)